MASYDNSYVCGLSITHSKKVEHEKWKVTKNDKTKQLYWYSSSK